MTSAAQSSAAEAAAEQLTRERLVHLVAHRLGALLPIHVAACAVVVPVLWSRLPAARLLLFSALVTAVATLQLLLTRRAAARESHDGLTAEVCLVGSALLGLCWGMAYHGFADGLDPTRRAVLLLVLLTLGLAAVPILSGLAGTAHVFVLALFAPVVARQLTTNTPTELQLALATLIFAAALVLVMGRVRASTRRGLTTRAEKELLTRSLNREILEHRQHERYYRSLLENSSDLITVRGPNGETLYESPSAAAILGADGSSARSALEALHDDDRQAIEDAQSTMSEGPAGATRTLEFRLRDKDGCWREMEAVARLLPDGPVKGAVVISSRDVTEAKQLARELARQHGLMRAIINAAPDPIFYKDLQGRYLGCNAAYERAMGHTLEQLLGRTDSLLLDEAHAARVAEHDRQVTESGAVTRTDEWIDTPEGQRLLLDTVKAPILDAQGHCRGIVGVCRDITETKLLQDKLRELAVTDGLTGLMNRRRLDEALGAEWARARRHGTAMSLLMIDIDHFKAFNDHYGHPEGDAVLTRLAGVLHSAVQRPGDVVARYGGEEFTVVLPHTDSDGARAIAERIQERLAAEAIVHLASPVAEQLTLSIGLACIVPALDQPASELIAAADQALYQAKNEGRNTIVLAPAAPPTPPPTDEPAGPANPSTDGGQEQTGSLFPEVD